MSVPETNLATPAQLLAHFRALDQFLFAHQQLWRPKPFTALQLGWETEHPQLARWLRARNLEQAEAAHNQPHLLAAPAPFPELARQAIALGQLGQLPRRSRAATGTRLGVDVPGRKWQQIEAFGSCLQFHQQPAHWLDWCAGKGHLGRYLAQDGSALSCVERDAQLVSSGQRLSGKLGIPARHIELDVLQEEAAGYLESAQTPVALHACGDLHVRLMQLASAAGCRQLAIAPCCYNRIRAEHYQPLSAAARASALQLERDDLRLLQCETVTAGQRVRKLRDLSMARRLGFDLLQRQVRAVDEYLPAEALAPAWLQRDFAAYCTELARVKQLDLGGEHDWATLETAGWQRLANVRNLELLRSLFRRPLEVWLLLDRALFLQAEGYRVRLGSFCDTRLTPRNLLLLAERE
ncbi:methyltransferase [Pseudomonas sp. N040]|uniref:methyltransferase n=1 Tax=Pseudomonas sp. N040 TaxID=2785325 RepID=UPI0018A3043E|nr:methyltransferase [Pseudomonas sp. N040]MBF7728527.1 methyltransferase [Pseudomonas sp. N040]MBW7012167.1 SAM-dependent methyltransferase [Pseudomonas sp. N040]